MRRAKRSPGLLLCLVLLAASGVAATGAAAPALAAGRVALAGQRSPLIARAQPAGRVPASAPIRLALELRPRHPRLLALLAARSGASEPLPAAELRALFLPRRGDVRPLRRWLGRFGVAVDGRAGLAVFARGSAGAVERAFGVTLARYRLSGRGFRAPASAPRLPAPLAGRVQAVDGLDTSAPARPLSASRVGPVTASCPGPRDYQQRFGAGLQPAQLAASDAYDFQPLLDDGDDGHGESAALLEFSNYRRRDVTTTFAHCYGLHVPVQDEQVAGGTRSLAGALEVELDIEVLMAAAPGLDGIHVYMAPNRRGISEAAIVNRVVADQPETHVHVLSISWGGCELVQSDATLAAEDASLQLAAVSGISVFAASGDTGASDCEPITGYPSVDDPASQPYATGVGGTTLHLDLAAGPKHETVWNTSHAGGGAGGGGVSALWPMPSWQQPLGKTPFSSSRSCGLRSGDCRQVPDVALDANDGRSSYIVYCTVLGECGQGGWLGVGGTSAAAPLLAAITADANSYSLAQSPAGPRLGFASPFLYHEAAGGSAAIHDITIGSNSIIGDRRYPAAAGYDLASGLGSVDAEVLARDLAGYSGTGSADRPDRSRLTVAPASDRRLHYGQTLVLHGSLVDRVSGAPIAGRVVSVLVHSPISGRGSFHAARTDAHGAWSLRLGRRALSQRVVWQATYLGEEGRAPARAAPHEVRVVPRLGLTLRRGVVRAGRRLRVRGATAPVMARRLLVLEERHARRGPWRFAGRARSGRSGHVSLRLRPARAGTLWLRWRYHGSSRGRWLSAASPAQRLRVRPR